MKCMGVEVELVSDSDNENEKVWLWKSEVPSEHGLTLVKVSSHADADYTMKWSIEVHAPDFNGESFFSYGMDMEGTESSARLGIEVIRAPSKYRLLEAKLAIIRLAHGDSESKEEDACLDEMDVVWLRLSPEERDKLNAPSRKVTTGICGPAGARHCPWCKAAADKFQNEKGDVLWHCHACYWTHTEAKLLYIEMAKEMNRSVPKNMFPKEALGPSTSSISSAELGDKVRMNQIYGSDRKPK